MRAGHHVLALLGDEGDPLGHPGVGDELVGLTLEFAQHGVHGNRDTGENGGDVSVDELGELVTVVAVEGAHLERGHAGTSGSMSVRRPP
ncbi:hypothetical protein GCM10010307_15430 [Streptomyces vastus]|uniref:Uncharacterized protein n=1 Tax=Streptomyces vastus TaxID=285451 RepID=A0ABN3QI26_9ACTN